jgi:hypothetical protein
MNISMNASYQLLSGLYEEGKIKRERVIAGMRSIRYKYTLLDGS